MRSGNPVGGPASLLAAAAELDDQPDYLSSNPEEQPHKAFHVVPARTSAAFTCHFRGFLPFRLAILRKVSAGSAIRQLRGSARLARPGVRLSGMTGYVT